MAFPPKDWRNAPDGSSPIDAAALVDMEVRLSDYTDAQAGAGGFSAADPHTWTADQIIEATLAVQTSGDAFPRWRVTEDGTVLLGDGATDPTVHGQEIRLGDSFYGGPQALIFQAAASGAAEAATYMEYDGGGDLVLDGPPGSSCITIAHSGTAVVVLYDIGTDSAAGHRVGLQVDQLELYDFAVGPFYTDPPAAIMFVPGLAEIQFGDGVAAPDTSFLRHAAGVMEIPQHGGGLRLTSPDGTKTKVLTIDNAGALALL